MGSEQLTKIWLLVWLFYTGGDSPTSQRTTTLWAALELDFVFNLHPGPRAAKYYQGWRHNATDLQILGHISFFGIENSHNYSACSMQ